MLFFLWLLSCNLSYAAAISTPIIPNANVMNNGNALLNRTSSVDVSWPWFLPYSWTDPETGIDYKYGFSARRVSLPPLAIKELFLLARDIASSGAIQHGVREFYTIEEGEQRFSASTGVLEIRIANVNNNRFTWGQLVGVIEGMDELLFDEQRYYKTWFEFWGTDRLVRQPPLGRGKMFKVGEEIVTG